MGEDTKLHEAVRYGDLEEVREALREGNDPNKIGTYQWSALHEASNNGDEDIVRVLLKYGGEPNKSDHLRGCTALHYAASQGHEYCVKLLLQSGGQFDVVNSDGQTCLDVAVGECRRLLQQQQRKTDKLEEKGDKDIHLHPPSKETILSNILTDTKPTNQKSPSNVDLQTKDINDNDSEQDSALFDIDDISIASDSTTSSSSHWAPTKVWGQKKELVLGSALMSFEYNSKKTTFKIRVWQIKDLLLPPADTSMISAIYVKSYLQPDKHKDSKRKTEHLSVKPTETKSSQSGDGKSVIFQPSSFTFTKALEYNKITKEMVQSRTVQIVVCVIQKYSRKSFSVATWNMPLQQAVRKLVKDKYNLTPCLSLQIPDNMKVYHAGQLQVTRSLHHSNSNPNLQRHPSTGSWAVPYSERSASDSELQGVRVDKRRPSNVPSIEITLPEEEDDQGLSEALQQIAVMEEQERRQEEGGTSIEMGPMLPGCAAGEGDELTGVMVGSTVQVAEVQVHMAAQREPPASQPTYEHSIDVQLGEHNSQKQKKKETKARRKSSTQHEKKRKCVTSREHDEEAELGSVSRPDTPTWDNYTEPLTVTMVPMDFEDDLLLPMDTSSHLPMAMTLEMPEIHKSFSRQGDKDEAKVEVAETSLTSNVRVMYEDDQAGALRPDSQGEVTVRVEDQPEEFAV